MKKLLLFTFILFGICANSQEISQNDKDALIALYNATDGANWTNKWDLNDSPENWYGIVTNVVFGASGAERHVDEINLSNNNLIGTLPAELGNLKSLNTLNLSGNSISGTIPGSLGNAKDLNYLYLQNNSLSGDIPTDLFTLNTSHFVEINFSNNKLTGKLPVEIGNAIANTGGVYVSNNLLTDLPDYTNISLFRINTLDISNNNINFSVFERVPSFDNIAKVLEDNVATLTYSPQNKINEVETVELNVGDNISFSITDLASSNNTYQWFKNGISIGGATNTTYQITGATLTDAGVYYCEVKNPNVPNLTLKRNTIIYRTIEAINDKKALIALYNSTDGANWNNPWDLKLDISTWTGVTINSLGRVIGLDLSFRKLKGILPLEIGDLTNLTRLNLAHNELTGSIPSEIGSLIHLRNLNLGPNQLTGNIPREVWTLTNLETLSLSFNKLTGSIPSEIRNLTNLISISLRVNELEGSIPQEIGNLTKLTSIILGSNKLTGNIPSEIGNLTNLTELWLNQNQLRGNIPTELGKLTNLIEIYLYSNEFSGELPVELGSLTNLKELLLFDNKITGSIPIEIGNLTNLIRLDLSRNKLTGSIPSELENLKKLTNLSLHANQLTGSIPLEIGSLTSLTELNLSGNQLNGNIPVEIGNLTNLTRLELRGNQLNGNIPVEIGNLTSLTVLYLSKNKLTGKLPLELKNIITLDNLTIQENHFVFEDLEEDFLLLQSKLKHFSYFPQVKIGLEETYTIDQNESITFIVSETTSNNNIYQWKLKGENISGATEKVYVINKASASDSGEYTCSVTNSIVTGLELFKASITLNVNVFDTDNDGVNNDTDKCSNTPAGQTVNSDGCSVNQLGVMSDREALIAFYNATDGPNWIDSWDLNADISTWKGVTVNAVGRVTELRHSYRKLNGTLPDDLGNLTELRKLTLLGLGSTDELTGNIPSSLCNLTKLEEIKIEQLNLTGAIPSCLFDIISLKSVSIYGHANMLTLDLPDDLSGLTNLTSLYLSKVDLSSEGGFPENILHLTNLERLYLFNNKLTGSIPTTIGNLTKLNKLSITAYTMSGSIPDEIGALGNLEDLSLNIPLTGVIPTSIGDLIKLKSLRITGNIEGEIPDSFSKLTSLYSLNLSWNKLTGQVPQFINTFSNLQSLELRANKLSGTIPDLTNLTKLRALYIDENQFVFEDFENEFNIYKALLGFVYQPQSNIDKEEALTVIEGNTVTLTVEATKSSNNIYQWRKDGVDIEGATSREYVIENIKLTDKGIYDCIISNGIVTSLKLTKNKIVLTVDPSDTDGDGIKDVDDLCLNTPAGETVNSNGCSESQLDDDNDGVFNNVDKCSDTPSGEAVNADGCSESQLDDDNDGVFNNVDKCPNTVNGNVVDANGCSVEQIVNIAPTDIKVVVNGSTCPGKSNGVVNMSFVKNYTYKVTLTGDGENRTFENVNYSSGLEISNLSTGTYEICITVAESDSFKQCYTIVIKAPEALRATKISLKNNEVVYKVSGSKLYIVTVNDEEFEYSFNTIDEKEIKINLINGTNSIEIKTGKVCQGTFNKSIINGEIRLYPVPVNEYLNIAGISENKAKVVISSLTGTVVLSTNLEVKDGIAILPINKVSAGTYIVTIITSTQTINTKILKK